MFALEKSILLSKTPFMDRDDLVFYNDFITLFNCASILGKELLTEARRWGIFSCAAYAGLLHILRFN
jgi:hypothetical protein